MTSSRRFVSAVGCLLCGIFLGVFIAPAKGSQGQAAQAQQVPLGTILPYAGKQPPAGFMIANGDSLEGKPDMEEVCKVIRGLYKLTNDPADICRLPNLQARVAMGAGTAAGLSLSVGLGQSDGRKEHIVSPSELPTHTHRVSGRTGGMITGGFKGGRAVPATDGENATHDVDLPTSAPSYGPAGSAFPILPPFLGVNYIVKVRNTP
jgi:microcystin-dependent protein